MLKKENRGLQRFLLIHLVITVVCSLFALQYLTKTPFHNFLLGQAFVWMSLASLSFSVYLFFLKKNIALLVSVIVFKWPILIYVVYKMTTKLEPAPEYLAAGFLPIFLSALGWSFLQKE